MERFEKILLENGCLKRQAPPAISIKEIEKKIGFELPEDYKIYLLNYQPFDDFIGEQCLRLWEIEYIVEGYEGYNIAEYFTNTIGIGSNMASEMIGLQKTDDNQYRIILTQFIGMDAPIEIVTSFSDFICRLEEGKEWFEDN